MASLNKKQVQLLFDREAVLLGTTDGVPLNRAVALFGEDAVNHAQHFEAGVYTNGYGVGDYTLPYLTIQGFQAAASFYNVQQVRSETSVSLAEDDAVAVQELLARAKAQNPSFATMSDQDLITLLIEKGFKKAGAGK